jgi:Cu+-exporting ATPase
MARDPVCDMDVMEEEAAITSTYRGKKYYFCCITCKEKFDTNPEDYLEKEEE